MNEEIKEFTDIISNGFDKIAEVHDLHIEDKEYFIEDLTKSAADLMVAHGIDKEASGYAFANKVVGKKAAKAIAEGMTGQELGKAIVGTGTTLAGGALGLLGLSAFNKVLSKYRGMDDRSAFKRSLADAVAENEILQEADQVKLRRMAESIYNVAPNIAKDPNILTNVLTNTIHGASIDLQTVKVLTEMEEKLLKTRGMQDL